jgi:hypothetical protein
MRLVKSLLENQPYYNLELIFRAFKRKEMKALRQLAENDIITRGVTVKIQQVAVRWNYENPSNDDLTYKASYHS